MESSGKTELEKFYSLEPYRNNDPAIMQLKNDRRKLMNALNAIDDTDAPRRLDAARKLFGSIGKGFLIKGRFHCDYGFNIHVGDNFFANFDCVLLDEAPITFGRNCMLGPQTCMYTVTHPMDSRKRAEGFASARPITVGDDVWFGGNCVVLGGVTIGNGAIIGAGSVVTKDVPPFGVVAGNPARLLRYTT